MITQLRDTECHFHPTFFSILLSYMQNAAFSFIFEPHMFVKMLRSASLISIFKPLSQISPSLKKLMIGLMPKGMLEGHKSWIALKISHDP